MSKAQKDLEDRIERMKIQKTWISRIEKINTSRASFCDKHGLDTTILCRLLKCNLAAGWKTIEKIESAFKAEKI